MSSLGYQWILGRLRAVGIAAERCFLPDDVAAWRAVGAQPMTYETGTPLGSFPLITVSLAYELELAGLIELLQLANIPPLARDRGPRDPVILLGGPLTFSNPLPAAPFVDAMLLGEADHTATDAVEAFFDGDREAWLDVVQGLPGGFVPSRSLRLPETAIAPDDNLPARSMILTPDTELASMFLLEGERGCHRQCTFCVMRRGTMGGMRLVTPERILSFVPEQATKVGLVGAAISDHPRLPELLQTLVDSGRGIGVSSLRADRIAKKPRIAELLRESGARTLTTASDAASSRLRKTISKGTSEQHLLEVAAVAKRNRFEVLKVYMMLGVPDETDADVDELIAFTLELASICRVALGVAPFVAKRNTPLDGAPWAGIRTVDARLKQLRRGLKGRARVRPASARWAWAEYVLAQGGPAAGEAVLDAVKAGGRFAHYRAAFEGLPTTDHRPWLIDSAEEQA
jgi:radical SAM superfamily enzyme YgiQ (UPF0313 family)